MNIVREFSYEEICNPLTADVMMQTPSQLKGIVVLNLSDGRIACSIRQALYNFLVWRTLTAVGIAIRKDHFIKRQPVSRGQLSSALNVYYDEIQAAGLDIKLFQSKVYELNETLYGFMTNKLQSYAATMDILRIAKIMKEPKMKEITDTRFQLKTEMGTAAIEKFISVQSKKIIKLLRAEPKTEEGLNDTLLHSYMVLGILNKFQIPQMLYAFGLRTDVNDTIMAIPVRGNATMGLGNAVEFVLESLAGKKPAFYNHGAIKRAQYFGRSQHIVASSVERLYRGDCGSKSTVKFRITEDNWHNTLGKNIVTNKGIVTLHEFNIKRYIGKTVHMRSAMTCRHTDGVCEVCAGKLAASLSDNINIGIVAAIQVVAKATQGILSAKHLINTVTIAYSLPDGTDVILQYLSSDTLTWNVNYPDIAKCYMGVPLEYFARFDTIPSLRKDTVIAAETMSVIMNFAIRKPNGEIEGYTAESADGNVPYLSKEMIMHIRDHYKSCTQDEKFIWIPLRGTEGMPILKTTVLNDNMLLYVTSITSFFSGTIKEFNSCSDALDRLATLVHSKVSVNIAWLDILLKSYLVTGGYDCRIPIVENSDDIRFGNMSFIISNRTVGGELAYEKLKDWVMRPQTYLIPKQSSIFDKFTIGSKQDGRAA